MLKHRFLWGFLTIFILLSATRFIWLDRFPPGMYHDEVEYALSSKTYALKGTDLSGIGLPLSLFKTNTLGKISPIPSVITSPLWSIFPLNLFTARLPYIILNILTALVLMKFIYILFKNKTVAFIAAVLFLLSPWSFFLSRFAVDAAFALFFFLLATVLFLTWQRWKLVVPFLLFFLGFFSYNGAKILLFPLLLVLVIYKVVLYKKDRTVMIEGGIVLAITTVCLVAFYLISLHIPGSILTSRSNEVFFLDHTTVSKSVNLLREQSIAFPFKSLFINKITETIRMFIQNYLIAFNPGSFFSYGDPAGLFSFTYNGLFYLFDGVLFLWGSVHLVQKQKKVAAFLFTLLFIAPIATASNQNGQSIVNRSFLLLPVILTFTSYGLFLFYEWLKARKVPFPSVVISAILLVPFIHFLSIYFFQLPVYGQENYRVSERVVANYIFRENPTRKIVVVSGEPREVYLEVVFYAPMQQQVDALKQGQTTVDRGFYTIGNASVVKICPKNFSRDTTYIVDSAISSCIPGKVRYLVLNQKDAGDTYKIYNGTLCDPTQLTRWRNEHLLSDYLIDNMPTSQFCRRWIFHN